MVGSHFLCCNKSNRVTLLISSIHIKQANLGYDHFGSSRMAGHAQRTFKVTLQKFFSRESREVS